MEWKPVSERLLHVRFKGKQANMSIPQCYAPINNAEDEGGKTCTQTFKQRLRKYHGMTC